MRRQIATWTIFALAVFGLTACSGSPSETRSGADTTTSTTTSATAPQTTPSAEEATTSAQSLSEACIQPSAQLAKASAQLMEASAAIANAGSKGNPKATIKAFTAVVDAFGAMAESATHPEVKDSLTRLHESYGELRDLLSKVLIDEDYSAAAEFATVANDVQESLTAFQDLCAG